MCIRDSYGAYAIGNDAPDLAVAAAAARISATAAFDMASRAVSYTHLRAHETVLDIVCRLLLETKNRDLELTLHS